MSEKKRWKVAAVVLAFAGGAAWLWHVSEQTQRDARVKERSADLQLQADRAAAATKADRPLTPRVISVGVHQMLVVDVPSVAPFGATLEARRCFVWRDAEFKVASMACDKQDQTP